MKIDDILENRADLTEKLTEGQRKEIGTYVKEGYEEDKRSRMEWEKANKLSLELALQVMKKKSYPWPGASNVKFPLVTIGAIQFAARVYPALVNGKDIVKVSVNGKDEGGMKAARAERISMHMSYQLLEEMEEWEEDMDRLLHVLPVIGVCFKKSYFDPEKGRNVSELVLANDLITNYYIKSLDDQTRVTHVYPLSKNELREKQLLGLYLDIDLSEPVAIDNSDKARTNMSPPETLKTTPHEILEQHCLWDLDGDGYEEPYIITVHKESGKLLRMEPRFIEDSITRNDEGNVGRIKGHNHFTKFGFIPASDGGFYDVGFGQLLGPVNEAVNSILNQLVDAGHLSNMGGGLMSRSIRLKGGEMRFRPGEWKFTDNRPEDLKKGIFPLPIKDPSNVMFSLLGLLIESGEKISSMNDPIVGKSPGTHVPGKTVDNLIEQGMKVFAGIGKRLHRSFKGELRKLFELNKYYLDEKMYKEFLDDPNADATKDYLGDPKDILPYSDPSLSSDDQRIAKAQFLYEIKDDPDFDARAIKRRLLDALRIPNVEEVMPEQPLEQPPDPALLIEQAKLEQEQTKLEIKRLDTEIERFEAEGRVLKLRAEALAILSETEVNVPDAQQVEAVDKYIEINEEVKKSGQEASERADGGGVQGVEEQPTDQGGF